MGQWPDSQLCVMVGKLVTSPKPYFPSLYHMGWKIVCYLEDHVKYFNHAVIERLLKTRSC